MTNATRNHERLPSHADVVVVGAGVVGAAVAHSLSQRGARVAVLDAADELGGGCSYANAALLAPSHVAPLSTRSAIRDAVSQVRRRTGAIRVHPSAGLLPWLGALAAAAVRPGLDQTVQDMRSLAEWSFELHANLHQQGLSPTFARSGAVDVYVKELSGVRTRGWLGPSALRELEPALGAVAGGVYDPNEAITESRSFIACLLNAAVRHSASIHFGHKAEVIESVSGRVVGISTNKGRLSTDHVVVASGITSSQLATPLGVQLPLRGGRGYIVDIERWPDAPTHAVRLKEQRVVVTPLPDRVRVAGYMEFGAEERPLDPQRARRLVKVASTAIPALTGRRWLDVWAGERPCLSDGVPAVGATRMTEGLSFAVGHAMWGLILAPATAELIAGDILGSPDRTIPPSFDPDRFS